MYADSDYSGYPTTHLSVTGYTIYIHHMPVCWKSRSQRGVTMTSSEAEWIALSEAVKDIIFVLLVCDSKKI